MCRPYLVLLPVGLAVPSALPKTRCALTAPFHHHPSEDGQTVLCGAIPGVASAGRYPAPCFRGARTFLSPFGERPSGHLTQRNVGISAPGVNLRKQRGEDAFALLVGYAVDLGRAEMALKRLGYGLGRHVHVRA